MIQYNGKNRKIASLLRKNMTDAERCVWRYIRDKQIKGLQFYRQKPILNYIVDFYCPKAKLVIEIDGGQHYEEEHELKDAERDKNLEKLGLKVIRYNNLDVLTNIDGVLSDLQNQLQ
jgi:very-short-patch-repair endonuclease